MGGPARFVQVGPTGGLGVVPRGNDFGRVGSVVGRPRADRVPLEPDDPLHAANSANPATLTAIAPPKGLQARSRPVD